MTLDKEIRATPKDEGTSNDKNRDDSPTPSQPSSASMLVASLMLALPVQARSGSGISTTQAADPNPATAGQPLTFTVAVTNSSAPQHVGLKNLFPEGAELVSATLSQGNCGSGHHPNAVQCTLGRSVKRRLGYGRSRRAPDGPGNRKEHRDRRRRDSPEVSDEATVEVKLAP